MKISKDTHTEAESTGRIWKTSILKTELAELPIENFKGKVTVVDSPEKAVAAVGVLAQSRIIGFDTETKPSFRRGERHTVALLQLSTDSESFLFRLNVIGMPAEVSAILEDESIMKVGLSIHDDFLNLHKCFRFTPRGFIDLQTYVKEFNIADNSLSRIYGIIFSKRISKGQRLSNWEAPVLSVHQQEYAALDALACLVIYKHLRDKGFDYTQSPYYREFDDPTAQRPTRPEKDS